MNKQIIAVDIDDVLADSTESLRKEVNRSFGVDLQPEHYRVPGEYAGYYDRVWAAYGVPTSLVELNPQMIKDQSHVEPSSAARQVLRKLSKRYKIVVLTARNPNWRPATMRWIDEHFPEIFDAVIFSEDEPVHKTKGEICKDMRVSLLIDDNPKHARSALDCGIPAILFGSYGWHINVPEGVIVCKDWAAVLEYCDGRS